MAPPCNSLKDLACTKHPKFSYTLLEVPGLAQDSTRRDVNEEFQKRFTRQSEDCSLINTKKSARVSGLEVYESVPKQCRTPGPCSLKHQTPTVLTSVQGLVDRKHTNGGGFPDHAVQTFI